ncbi:MAG: VWA domain-containing protein [Desulfuromonadaceae bacterium]|nr:VWA domain-containing protein [Desulfuromonadaceae bacterium]
MNFAAPEYLWLIPLLLLPAILLTVRASLKRRQALDLFADPHLAAQVIHPPARSWRIAATICGMAALLCMVFALMRPQWGVVSEEQASSGLDIVIALDVSRSMLADDLRPNRLAVAKSAIGRLLDLQSGNRIGVIAFSGTAVTVCPLTADYAIVRQIVNELTPDSLPRGGSSVSAALREARRAFRGAKSGGQVLMLVSDGEDHDGDIAPAVAQAKGAGIVVMAALAGSEDGGLMPLPGGGFVKDRNGAVVKSRASRAVMAAIDPAVVSLGPDGAGLELLLQRARAAGSASERREQRTRPVERFQLPLAAALLLLCLSTVFGRGVNG